MDSLRYNVRLVGFCFLGLLCISVKAHLTSDFYDKSCPQIYSIVASEVEKAAKADPRNPASLIRLHFHDCIVNGCDASVLLDEGPKGFSTEKTSKANNNSLRGFEIIDSIKAKLEYACPGTVSCADILAITSRDSALKAGLDYSYEVLFGRRDSLNASVDAANFFIPSPFFNYSQLILNFHQVGLDELDLVTLSGAHTIGRVRCFLALSFVNDTDENPDFAKFIESVCPNDGNQTSITNLDFRTPNKFDKNYYVDLLNGEGVLRSDETLFSTPGSNVNLVKKFAQYEKVWFKQFGKSTIKMGNISPLTGHKGEIRLNCRKPNGIQSFIAFE